MRGYTGDFAWWQLNGGQSYYGSTIVNYDSRGVPD